jgi:hypothetical protein
MLLYLAILAAIVICLGKWGSAIFFSVTLVLFLVYYFLIDTTME